MTTECLGPHMMLDCYGCPKDKLADLDLVSSALGSLPAKIGLTGTLPAHVFRYTGQAPEDSGVSGVMLGAEAHVSVHTFPEQGHAFVDLFSLRDFDTEHARRALTEAFAATDHEVVLVSRGPEVPRRPLVSERPRLHH